MSAKEPRPMPTSVVREADLLKGTPSTIDKYGRNQSAGIKAVIKPLPPPPPPASSKSK
jgi:hypothetical protein